MTRSSKLILAFVFVIGPTAFATGATVGYGIGKLFFPVREPAPLMTAEQFAEEWRHNPAAASNKYDHEPVMVVGHIQKISAMMDGSPYFELEDGVTVYPLRSGEPGLRKCQIGQRVAVHSRGTPGPFAFPCIIVDEVTPLRQ